MVRSGNYRIRGKVTRYLYNHDGPVIALEIIDDLKLNKNSVYQALNKMIEHSYADVIIDSKTNLKKYEMSDAYRNWIRDGIDRGVDVWYNLGIENGKPVPKVRTN